jgi:hypothetical protein
MRIGISLTGVSYMTSGKKRDFRKTYENFFKTTCNPLSASVYTTTYPHELQDEFLAAYKPKKHQFIPFEGSHPRSTFVYGLCLVEEEELDFIICTRFDIKFNQKITDMNVDFDKFNFIFKEGTMWDSHKFVSDTFFAFPRKYLYDLADSVQELCHEDKYPGHTFMHHIYEYVIKRIGENNVNFLCGDEQALSHQNRFFDLVRTEI